MKLLTLALGCIITAQAASAAFAAPAEPKDETNAFNHKTEIKP